MKDTPHVMIVNGNDPADVAKILVRAVFEFSVNNFEEKQRPEIFDNIINSIAEFLLSEDGKTLLKKAVEG